MFMKEEFGTRSVEWTNKITHRVWDAAIEIASLSSSRIVLAMPFAAAAAAAGTIAACSEKAETSLPPPP